jgi:hypothetical protein
MSQIGKLDCRGGERKFRRRKTEFARERKSNEKRNAPMGASRETTTKASQFVV